MAPAGVHLGAAETDLLIGLRLGHFRVDLDLEQGDWTKKLHAAARAGIATATHLELGLRLGRSGSAELDAFDTAARVGQAGIARFILQSSGVAGIEVLGVARQLLTRLAPKATFAVVGPPTTLAGPGIETVRSYAWDAERRWTTALEEQTASRPDGHTFVASPVMAPALGHRGTRPAGAAFALASVASLATRGATSITYAVQPGWGVVRRIRAAPAVTPAYHVLADLGEFEFGQIGEVTSTAPDRVSALCAYTVEGVTVLVANTTHRPQRVLVELPTGRAVRVRLLDAASSRRAMEDPDAFRRTALTRRSRSGRFRIDLDAFAVARFDA